MGLEAAICAGIHLGCGREPANQLRATLACGNEVVENTLSSERHVP
jgi:hypothetical protein